MFKGINAGQNKQFMALSAAKFLMQIRSRILDSVLSGHGSMRSRAAPIPVPILLPVKVGERTREPQKLEHTTRILQFAGNFSNNYHFIPIIFQSFIHKFIHKIN